MTQAVDSQKQVITYMQLLQQGVPAPQAFAQAFPNGIPTALDRQKEAAKAQQGTAYGQVGGLLAGALGSKAIFDAVTGKPILGGIGSKLGNALGLGESSAPLGTSVDAGGATTSLQAPIFGGAYESPMGLAASGEVNAAEAANALPLGEGGVTDLGSIGPGTTGDGSSLFNALGGNSAPFSSTVGNVAGGVGAALGSYNAINDWQHGGSGRSGLTEAGAGAGTMVMPGIGTAIGAVGGNILGYGLQGNGWKNDAALVALGPPGWAVLGAKKLGFNPIHTTTRQVQQGHTSDLLKQGQDNAAWQNLVSGIRQQYNAAPPDPSHPFGDSHGNKYATFDEYQNSKTGLDASNLTNVYGNLNHYGPAWASYTPDQQRAITQENINLGNYGSHKGEVVILDPAKADAARQKVLGIQVAQQAPPLANTPYNQAAIKQNGQFGTQLFNALTKGH